MIADSYFEIGSTHLVCQDYAVAGVFEDMAYAIVADGCSSADFSEIGASMLCHIAKYQVQILKKTGVLEQCSPETLSKLLAGSIAQKANEIKNLYLISSGALQSTLLITLVYKDCVWVFAYGDGVIISKYKKHDGSTTLLIEELDYPTNAPCYLCLNKEAYRKEYPDSELVYTQHEFFNNESRVKDEKRISSDSLFYYVTNIHDMNRYLISISICSDGIKTFYDDSKKEINLGVIAQEFTNYASNNGVFVQRCMNFLKRKNFKNNIVHHDDISCATILL
jgi:Protein phosphatase 2C